MEILTIGRLAERLQVKPRWVYEQTRSRIVITIAKTLDNALVDGGMKMNLSIVPSRPTEPDFDAMVLSYRFQSTMTGRSFPSGHFQTHRSSWSR